MKVFLNYSKAAALVITTGLLLSACSIIVHGAGFIGGGAPATNPAGERINNGERIFFSGTNQQGERIRYRQGPNFGGMMMGTYLTCASCHGPEGRGGIHIMHMTRMDAPDIRYAALAGDQDEHVESESDHQDEHSQYDIRDFRLAVIGGKHPNGEPLSPLMPRWEMSQDDLADLFEFIKSIP